MNIVILGPQASGKGTQADLLVKKYGLFYLEMGQILRDLVEKKDKEGEKIASFINQGHLVPDEMIMEVLGRFLTPANLQKGILFDGFPRNLSQAEIFQKELEKYQAKIDKVIFLKISTQESLKRLSGRRHCSCCGRDYNLVTMPPKQGEICDDDGCRLVAREDETPEDIKQRLSVYQRETLPVIDFYRQEGILLEVDGERSIEAIHQEILKGLG
jgi:adenylate kinase